jgi:hypothetical protein
MGRTRDVSKILTSNTSILSLASASSTYQTIAKTGLVEITPSAVSTTGGTGSISATGVVSFTSASAISLNDVFSTSYDNYRLIANVSQSDSSVGMACRVRVSGSDLTSSTYKWARYFNFSNDAAYLGGNSNSTTSMDIPGGITDRSLIIFDIGNPFNLFNTHVQIRTSFLNSSSFSYNFTNTGSVNNTLSYTGFTIFPSAGTITGTISVYGYNK